ncbi:MAG TPA: tyrosine-protein phosphatase [Bryobacteraceae bacterium]|nr:tyrosine-protein phosphatase [Bryobacteraceae bacterium]
MNLSYAIRRRSWPLAVSLALAAVVSNAAAETWRPSCDETRTGRYTFEHLDGSSERPAVISLCPDVHCASRTAFASVTADTYSAPRPPGLARPYFLVERQGEKRIIGARRLALQGAYNFRDLGGIQTSDGKTIRWGQVFRSDTLTRLTSADYARLNALGIGLVCDLRTREERKTDPTEWQQGSPVFVLAPVSENDKGSSENNTLMDALRPGQMPVEDAKKVFEQFYVRMVFDSASKFGAVLRAIETSDRPSMFHCTGGRDRTGITAALLLHILGVPRETILADFVLSTRYLNERPARESETRQPAISAEVLRLQPRYIEAVFKAIDQRYGSFDAYRREALHFTDDDVSALKTRLLE